MPLSEREDLSKGICSSLLGMLNGCSPVMIYVSKPPEVNTDTLISALIAKTGRVIVPIIERETVSLRLSYLEDPSVLVESTFHVPEPIGSEIPARSEEVTIAVIPVLGFDRYGNRLGYGAGYYDRFLEKNPNITRIGLAFACQEIPVIPCDANDVKMDIIVTENGVFRWEEIPERPAGIPCQHEEYPEISSLQTTTDGDHIHINFGGFVSLSTIDWRGKSVCTVFLRGCPLRCSYCQNEDIQEGEDLRDIAEVFEMIRTSSPFISGVIFSGGEPTMQKEGLIALARYSKNLGLAVGIQTNGFYPDTLESLLSEGLADKVAIDYKTTWEGYSGASAGSHLLVKNNYGKNVLRSIDLCKNAFKKRTLDDFEIVFTIFYENMEYLREISRKIGDVPLVLQQGEHKMAVPEYVITGNDPRGIHQQKKDSAGKASAPYITGNQRNCQ